MPLPVGRYEDHAPRALNGGLELDEGLVLEPELRQIEFQLVLVEQPHDDLLAEERRQHRHAEIDFLAAAALLEANLDAAVLGRRFSAMSMPAMILRRLISGPFMRSGMRSRSTHSPSMR